MRISLPPDLPYPIVFKGIKAKDEDGKFFEKLPKHGDRIELRDVLFNYSYQQQVSQQISQYDEEEELVTKTFGEQFLSPAEGTFKNWFVWIGDRISGPKDICEIEEDCTHTIQWHGVCVNCGKDLTGSEAEERADIQATHDTADLKISREEASEADEYSKRRLLKARKLSLVVDLDQTIIHAAVDPTIGEWQKDPDNPNYEALRDVCAFQLLDDTSGMRGCWYYIKLRPGLQQFLENVADKYELHIYTMGTRAYAQQIAKIVDSERKFFDDRILSRDESGSMVAKNLTRLFPVDTRMVVIIDDRGDVWQHSPNLVRVTAFEFFRGIGDINAGFLPKKQEIPSTQQNGDAEQHKDENPNGQQTLPDATKIITQDAENGETDMTALRQVIAMNANDTANGTMAQTQESTLASQLEEKPLLKLQQKMDEKDAAETNGTAEPATQSSDAECTDSESSISVKAKRHAILRNDDEELVHLERSLLAVHERYFTEFDRRHSSGAGGRVAALAGKRKEPLPEDEDMMLTKNLPDVKQIMPAMKTKVLKGAVIVFSGVIPLGADIHSADIAMWARSFGAIIGDKVTKETTHVIAARVGTQKVKNAVKRSIPVVSTQWLSFSIQRWKKLDVRPYLIPNIGQKQLENEPSSELGALEPDLLNDNRFDSGLLSEEESSALDQTEDDNEDQPRRKKPRLEVDLPPQVDENYSLEMEDHSPVDLDKDQWGDINDELKDFLGDDFDSESDSESVRSDRSLATRSKKRSRGDNDTGDSDRENDSDGETRNGDHKRQKSSKDVGSGLKAVSNADSNKNTPVQQTEEEDEDDILARELEAELERELSEENET